MEGSDFRLTVDGYNGNAGDTLRSANDELYTISNNGDVNNADLTDVDLDLDLLPC